MGRFKNSFVRDLLRPVFPALISLSVFSFFTTLLMLVPSVYTMQLSERVLLSRNEATLLFLTGIALFLLAVMAVLDGVRYRVLRRIGVALDDRINGRVFEALNAGSLKLPSPIKGLILADLNTFREFIGGPTIIHLMDVVWVPLIVGVMFLLHPFLGLAMTVLLTVTVSVTLLNQWIVFSNSKNSQAVAARAHEFARAVVRNAETVRAMGMVSRLRDRWLSDHRNAIAWQSRAQTRAEFTGATLYFLRNSQQVLLMLVATSLYLMQQVTAGVVFAIVFIGIRAIGPVIALAASWRGITGFLNAVDRLNAVLVTPAAVAEPMALPRPKGALSVSRILLTADQSEKIVLSDVSFTLASGRVLGVVGPSGAGKSSLAKLLVGAWRPRRGSVLIDGNDLAHWSQDELGQHIGYVPQEVEFLPGTVAENIARFSPGGRADHAAVLEAAEVAGIQDIVQGLPNGFNTVIGPDGYTFSGGQRQRIALARALYGNPSLMVLDEPNSNLDTLGEQSLGRTLNIMRERGCTAVIVTHRVNMLAYCDDVLVMNNGTVHTFGPRDSILRKLSALKAAPAPAALEMVATSR